MLRRTVPLAIVVTLTFAGVASADVRIQVPSQFLGGRVAPANPLPPPDPAEPNELVVDGEVDVDAPDFWDTVWPGDAGALAVPDDVDVDCADSDPEACGVWLDDAATQTPIAADPPAPEASPTPGDSRGPSLRLKPSIGTWMISQTPKLRWTAEPGASMYNVQIYLGPRRVASAWTTRTHLIVPKRVIDQGRYYMWAVWPATGTRTAPTFGQPLGRSIFGVVLRPRVVFRATQTGVVGEVRPRIPGGLLSFKAPGGAPLKRRIGPDSRVRLPGSVAQAERMTIRLLDPGTRPPKGLRARR